MTKLYATPTSRHPTHFTTTPVTRSGIRVNGKELAYYEGSLRPAGWVGLPKNNQGYSTRINWRRSERK